MAGSLYHAIRFEKNRYLADDGHQHYEIIPVNGDIDIVSISSWIEIQEFCEEKGIPRSAWPEFQNGFDVPLDEVREKNENMSKIFDNLTPEDIKELYWLEKIVSYVKRGELFCFTVE